MLCTLVERPPEDPRRVHEIKLDGYRFEAIIPGGQARLITRNERDWTHRFPETAEALGKLPDCILDGELVAPGPDDQPDFAALQAAMHEGTTAKLRYYVFDLLELGGKDMRKRPLNERKDELKRLLSRPPPGIIFLEHFTEPGAALLGSACRLGLEGIVSKRTDSPYIAGRGPDWLKAKCRGSDEFVVGGYGAGPKGRMTLLLGAWRGGKLVYLGRAGSGISAEHEEDLRRRLEPLRRRSPPFVSTPSERRDTTWSSRTSWLESTTPAGPGAACCARPPTRASGRTSPRRRLACRSPASRRPGLKT